MTRDFALTLVNRHVRIVHGGPDYVQAHDPEGIVVEVTETQIFIRDPDRPQAEPRGWHLAAIARVVLLDVPLD